MGPGLLGGWEKVVTPPRREVFRTDLQPTYHPHGPLWGIEFSLAPAPKPNQSAPKRAKLSGADSRAHLEGLDLLATVNKSIKIRFW